MPFPWKKVKSTRFSQLVNDHLHHSQRRRDGSSLVVETGFPTSLVDLFMKNREKLKKTSKKKRQSPPIASSDVDDPVIAGSPPSSPSPLPSLSPMISPPIAGSPTRHVHSSLHCPSPSRSSSVLSSKGVDEILDVGSSDGGICVGGDERQRGANANGVLLVILKMFLVVILALGTDRLTIGITISAFLLFFLEYAGKHVTRLSKPCSESKLVLMVQRVRRLLRFKEEDKLDGENCGALMSEMQKDDSLKSDCALLKTSGSGCPIQESQHLEPKIYLLTRVEEIQSENEIIGCSNFIESLEIQETELKKVMTEKEESISEVAESKRKKSKKAKIKSKIKKFVPKNLRRSRKEQIPERLENISVDNLPLCEEQEVDQWDIESSSGLSSISSGRYKKEDCMNAICPFRGLSEVDEKSATNQDVERGETKAGQSWIYLVFCLIVLIGLIRGRVFAFVLALSWCLLLKIGERLPRYIKLPRIGSFDDKSC